MRTTILPGAGVRWRTRGLGAGIVRDTPVRDVDELRDLKREYLELVRTHGEEATGFKAFKPALLQLNRRHRLEAVRMYVDAISKIQKKAGRKK
jgi:hypothetical protein